MSFFKMTGAADGASGSSAAPESGNSTGASNWTGLLRQAVTSMEQHIDRVLDAPTARPPTSAGAAGGSRHTSTPMQRAQSDTRLARRLEATVRQSLARPASSDAGSDGERSQSLPPQMRSTVKGKDVPEPVAKATPPEKPAAVQEAETKRRKKKRKQHKNKALASKTAGEEPEAQVSDYENNDASAAVISALALIDFFA
ncbi:hypothetical protein THASP1DRAFT_31637 [Thamnocephalis sphaerospora]|uniref:Uncharacterized protein n=1 Tax=Thamnocephalis sphaerospora TaxID=78915 RepID=A0A4P9XL37_9FUNG|nr:hypothetical protein THASP1DRAFT_31637 [Thamnocephalis sphaerospora]|eukprot:RKP06548.1 hypothetical protein THASP1DRAFT_31637 [Thamnocephalis sphaerospora]